MLTGRKKLYFFFFSVGSSWKRVCVACVLHVVVSVVVCVSSVVSVFILLALHCAVHWCIGALAVVGFHCALLFLLLFVFSNAATTHCCLFLFVVEQSAIWCGCI